MNKLYGTAILFLLLVLGCTTSRGALFHDVVKEDVPAAEKEEKGEKESAPQHPPEIAKTNPIQEEDLEEGEELGLYIRTFPEDAEIYINGTYEGLSPLLIQDLGSGSYRLQIVHPGYYQEDMWITLEEDTRVELDFHLRLITGSLSVHVAQEGAEVILDGKVREAGLHELPIGKHTVRIRKFGYDDYNSTVLVKENQTFAIDISLEKAVFEITDLHTSKTVLNPENPGKLGEAQISFLVSCFGEGTLSIYNQEYELLFSLYFPDFITWSQEFSWDGTDSSGSVLPDGEYIIEIEGTGIDGTTSNTVTALSIDRRAVIRFRSILSGTSGFMYSGTPEVLPEKSFQISSLILGHYDPETTPVTYLFPIQLGMRISPMENLEVDAQGTLYLQSSEINPFSIGLSGKYRFLSAGSTVKISAAVAGKGTLYRNDTSDSLTNFSGVSLGVPFLVSAGPVGLSIMPEFTISGTRVLYSSELSPSSSSSPYIWGYGRAALFTDFGPFTAGISTAIRTLPFSEGFGIHLPAALGGEVHFLIPGTQFVVSLALGMEISSSSNFYIMGGGGVGIIE